MNLKKAYSMMASHGAFYVNNLWKTVNGSLINVVKSTVILAIGLPLAVLTTIYFLVVLALSPVFIVRSHRKNVANADSNEKEARQEAPNSRIRDHAAQWMEVYPEAKTYRRIYALARGLEPIDNIPGHANLIPVPAGSGVKSTPPANGYAYWADAYGYDMSRLITDTSEPPDWATHIVVV